MFRLFEIIGKKVLKLVEEGGKLTIIFFKTLLWTFRRPLNLKNILTQIEEVGVNSIPVIIITGAFTGMVLSLQSHTGFKRFGAETFVGTVVALSMTRELGPVLSGLMVSGIYCRRRCIRCRQGHYKGSCMVFAPYSCGKLLYNSIDVLVSSHRKITFAPPYVILTLSEAKGKNLVFPS